MLIAQDFTSIQNNGLPGNTIPSSVGGIMSLLLPYVFSLVGIGLLIYIVMAGFQLMTSKGNPQKIEAAKAKITTALIGFIIIFLSFSLVKLLGLVLGINTFGAIFR